MKTVVFRSQNLCITVTESVVVVVVVVVVGTMCNMVFVMHDSLAILCDMTVLLALLLMDFKQYSGIQMNCWIVQCCQVTK